MNDITALRNSAMELYSYDPETGVFTHRVTRRSDSVAGEKAGSIGGGQHPCVQLHFNGKHHAAHRIAFLIAHGTLPRIVDHINCNPLDNRLCNLRAADYSGNAMNRSMGKNNTSGIKGVFLHKATRKWIASIRFKNKQIHLGIFEDKEQAAKAYQDAAIRYHGEFANIARAAIAAREVPE